MTRRGEFQHPHAFHCTLHIQKSFQMSENGRIFMEVIQSSTIDSFSLHSWPIISHENRFRLQKMKSHKTLPNFILFSALKLKKKFYFIVELRVLSQTYIFFRYFFVFWKSCIFAWTRKYWKEFFAMKQKMRWLLIIVIQIGEECVGMILFSLKWQFCAHFKCIFWILKGFQLWIKFL